MPTNKCPQASLTCNYVCSYTCSYFVVESCAIICSKRGTHDIAAASYNVMSSSLDELDSLIMHCIEN